MTGYGRGELMQADWRCIAEIKAVNHRYCDISIKMPSMMNPFEDSIRKMLSSDVHRGKVDVYIRVDSFGQTPAKIEVNMSVANSYIKALNKLVDNFDVSDKPTLAMLASNHDVFMVDKSVSDETRNAVWAVVESTLKEAVKQFTEMRHKEGQALSQDIFQKRDRILTLLADVKQRLPYLSEDYEKRLRARIEEMLKHLQDASIESPDESRILMELAIYAERIAVDEEITRLESHLVQFDSIMSAEKSDEPVGRKLDFLVQELNREVNTIGSKSNDVTMSKLVIEMKGEIEKIREQVQNVE